MQQRSFIKSLFFLRNHIFHVINGSENGKTIAVEKSYSSLIFVIHTYLVTTC